MSYKKHLDVRGRYFLLLIAFFLLRQLFSERIGLSGIYLPTSSTSASPSGSPPSSSFEGMTTLQIDLSVSTNLQPSRQQQEKKTKQSNDGNEWRSVGECSPNGEQKGSVTCTFQNVCVAEGRNYNRNDANIFFFDVQNGDKIGEEQNFADAIAWGAEAIKQNKDISYVHTVTDQAEVNKLLTGAREWIETPTVLFNRRHRSGFYHFFGQDVATLFHVVKKARQVTPMEKKLNVEFLMQSVNRRLEAKPSDFGYWAKAVLDKNTYVPLSDVDSKHSSRDPTAPCSKVRIVDPVTKIQKEANLCGRWKCYRTVTVGGDLPITEQTREEMRGFSSRVLENLEVKRKCSRDVLVGLINREEHVGRHVRNMKEVEELLEKNNIPFKSIKLENLLLKEQVASVAEMDVVVTPHGAGVTHEVFLRDGSALIELFPWSVDKEHDMYAHIAKVLGYDYVPIIQATRNETLYSPNAIHSNDLTKTKKDQQEAFTVMMKGVRENRGRFDQENWLRAQTIGGKRPNEREAVMLSEVFFRQSDIWVNPEWVFNTIVTARDKIVKRFLA
eukprot:Nk52_evm2s914 gene=Nk52_evmTU2s914